MQIWMTYGCIIGAQDVPGDTNVDFVDGDPYIRVEHCGRAWAPESLPRSRAWSILAFMYTTYDAKDYGM